MLNPGPATCGTRSQSPLLPFLLQFGAILLHSLRYHPPKFWPNPKPRPNSDFQPFCACQAMHGCISVAVCAAIGSTNDVWQSDPVHGWLVARSVLYWGRTERDCGQAILGQFESASSNSTKLSVHTSRSPSRQASGTARKDTRAALGGMGCRDILPRPLPSLACRCRQHSSDCASG